MYSLPATGGVLNPLKMLFLVIAACVFVAGLLKR